MSPRCLCVLHQDHRAWRRGRLRKRLGRLACAVGLHPYDSESLVSWRPCPTCGRHTWA